MRADKPNIILINCDDLGYGDVGCYGSKLNRTPNIDKLAEEGMKFTDFYMPDSLCTPSRAGMLTGCYPARISFDTLDGMALNKARVLFPGDPVGLHPDEITFAKILQDEGYATSLVGKWHVGDQEGFLPTDHGFDEFFGLPFSNDMGRQDRPNRPEFPPLPLMRGKDIIQEQPDQAGLTERYVSESLDFIRKNKEKPFLLYFAHMYVHTPIHAPKPYLDKSKNGAYGAAVEHIDWSLAAIMHELKKLDIDDNTLVIFTSDNGALLSGGGSNGELKGTKGCTFEGGIRLPCIMRWPDKIKAGQISDKLCTAMDFLPTFANMANTDAPNDRIIDGKNILPLMTEEGAESPHEAFFYYLGDAITAVRSGEWKYWPEEKELFNLKEDVSEKNNLYSKHSELIPSFEELIKQCGEDIGDSKQNVKGKNRRALGKVENPKPLTEYNPEHPYIIAMYD